MTFIQFRNKIGYSFRNQYQYWMEKQEQDGMVQGFIAINPVDTKRLTNENSSDLQQYHQAMNFQSFDLIDMNEIKAYLNNENIKMHQTESFMEEIYLKIISQSINREVIILQASWGFFSTDIKIINIKGSNTKHGSIMGEGSFGCIEKGYYEKKVLIIKCLTLNEHITRQQAIKQWFILKIASAVKCGPKISTCFGFDILMYENCVEFSMELCQQIEAENFHSTELYESLKLMHKLHLVHMDIKPDNIMFSPSHQRMVFIDFGLSRLIAEEIGFKEITGFRGSLHYCSDEMKNCFLEDKLMAVDLYYNDFCCLKKSVEEMDLVAASSDQSNEDEDKKKYEVYQNLTFPAKINSFEYCGLFFIKWALYTLKCQQGLTHLNKMSNSDIRKSFVSEILEFLFQLPPCEQLKHFFQQIIDQSFNQTSVYTQMRLIYQIAQQRLCSIELLRDQEKQKLFSSYCQSFEEANVNKMLLFSAENNKLLTLADLMTNKKLVKQIPFKGYADFYMQYISYTNNKYKVNAVEREKAAIVYYEQFISQTVPSELKSRVIVEKTIRHIMQWMLNTHQFEGDRDNFAIFAFRMLDFIVILSAEEQQCLVDLINSIFKHQLLDQVYKVLFLMKCKQNLFLIAFRLLSPAQQPRIQITCTLLLWIQSKVSQQSINKVYKRIISEQDQSTDENWLNISKQFMSEFGVEIIQFHRVMRDHLEEKDTLLPKLQLVELFNNLSASSKHLKIYCCLLALYDYYYSNQPNLSLCRKVYNIVKDNFQDESLLSEYLFQFQLNLWFPIKLNESDKISIDTLCKLNSILITIKQKDFGLLLRLLQNDFYRIYTLFKNKKVIKQNQLNFFSIYYRSSKATLEFKLFEETQPNNYHYHVRFIDVFNHRILQKVLESGKVQHQILSTQKLESIKCSECKDAVSFYLKIEKLFNYMFGFVLNQIRGKKQNAEESGNFLELYLLQTCKIEQQLIESQLNFQKFLSKMKTILVLKLNFCKINFHLQDKCHGIITYYLFALKYNQFQSYFCLQYQVSDAIQCTMLFLFKTNKNYFLNFLIKLIQVLESTLLYPHYFIIVFYFSSFLSKTLNRNNQLQLFIDLKSYQSNYGRKSGYISVIFAVLFKYVFSKKLLNKLGAAIIKEVHKVHTSFQRKIMIIIFEKVLQNLKNKREKSQRKINFCNNKLLKLLMIEGKTKPTPLRKENGSVKQQFLVSKIGKIQRIRSQNYRLNFRAKQNLK